MPRMISGYALVLLVILVAGCSPVTTIEGVELVAPTTQHTATPAPTPTPDPRTLALTGSVTKDFVGTTVSMNYPETWDHGERGQFFYVFDPAAEEPAPGINVFIQLTSTTDVADDLESMAPSVMREFSQRLMERGFADPESVPAPEQIKAFLWDEHDAAICFLPMVDGTNQVNLVIMDKDRARFVSVQGAAPAELWTEVEPTFLAILGTLTLNGNRLRADDLFAAYRNAADYQNHAHEN